ncbi:MAG: DUF3800 domain-containing protein [Deltaproteobacteria bacterium]|nr:DUF3800 domain-containing protein [Deltaproteobacteria bacterium]
MWFLYLDESGDLGFDFVNKKPSKFFTITILALRGNENHRKLIQAVKKTLARKINPKGKRSRIAAELKGTETTLEVKKYFYNLVESTPFAIYSLTLNKRRVYEKLIGNKARIYNFIARQVLDKLPFENAESRVYLYIDKSKNQREIREFNGYITSQLAGRLEPSVPLDIFHRDSKEIKPLQAVDLFSWGIFRKYEKRDTEWYDVFAMKKIQFDDLYLPDKKNERAP